MANASPPDPQRPAGLLDRMRAHPRESLIAGALAPLLGIVAAAIGAAAVNPGLGAALGLAVTLIAIPALVWGLTRVRR